MTPDVKVDISVVTPTLNRARELREAMDSVRAQTLVSWEHIVVDDGSTDGTADDVRARAAADPRVRYIQRASGPAGANACRNIGMRESRAELIVFLDSDDMLAPHCLQQRVEALAGKPQLDFAVFPGWILNGSDRGTRLFSPRTAGDDLDRVLFLDHPWQTSGPTWRRPALTKIGGFNEKLPSWQDVDLNVRALIASLRYKKYGTPDHHVRWTYAAEKISVKQFSSPDHLVSGAALVREFQARLIEAGLLTATRRRALAGLWFLLGERWIRLGQTREARRAWLSAYRLGLTPLAVALSGLAVLMMFRRRLLPPDRNERLLERFKIAAGFRFRPQR